MEFFAQFRPYSSCPLLKIGESEEFRYFGSPGPISRPPNPTGCPAASKIGNMTRLRKRARTRVSSSRFTSKPASSSCSSVYPSAPSFARRTSASVGAKPISNRSHATRSSPRDARYACAEAPSGDQSVSRNNSAAAPSSAHTGSRESRTSSREPRISTITMPARSAAARTAVGQSIPPCFWKKVKTSPLSPHLKQ